MNFDWYIRPWKMIDNSHHPPNFPCDQALPSTLAPIYFFFLIANFSLLEIYISHGFIRHVLLCASLPLISTTFSRFICVVLGVIVTRCWIFHSALTDMWVDSRLELWRIKLLWLSLCKLLYRHMFVFFLISLGKILGANSRLECWVRVQLSKKSRPFPARSSHPAFLPATHTRPGSDCRGHACSRPPLSRPSSRTSVNTSMCLYSAVPEHPVRPAMFLCIYWPFRQLLFVVKTCLKTFAHFQRGGLCSSKT